MAVELATAYVSIIPDTSRIAPDIRRSLNRSERDADHAGRGIGSRLSAGMSKALTAVKWAGAAGAGVALGAAVTQGFTNAINQGTAQKTLAGLYNNAAQATDVMQKLRDVSSKSPLEYNTYTKAAQSLAYAGVKGDEAVGILRNVGTAITSIGGTGENMNRANDALLKMVNAGKVGLDSLQQLSDAGVPIISGLAAHFGVSMDQVNKMASSGEIGLQDVLAVMKNGTGDTFQSMLAAGESASKSFGNQWKIAKDNVLSAIGQAMVPVLEGLAPVMARVGEAVAGFFRGLSTGEGAGGVLASALRGLGEVLMRLGSIAVPLVKAAFSTLGAIISGITGFVRSNSTVFGILASIIAGALVPALTVMAARWTMNMVLLGAFRGVVLAAIVAQNAMTAAQWLMNAAMNANPMMLVATAIAALVAGLVYFFTQTELGRQVWETVWNAITTAMSAAWEFIRPIWDGMLAVLGWVGDRLLWLWHNVTVPAMQFIGMIIAATWHTVIRPIWDAFIAVLGWLGNTFMFVWHNVIKPAWEALSFGISWYWNNVIKVAFDALTWVLGGVGSFFGWVWNAVIKPAWEALGTGIAWVWNNVIKVAFDALTWVLGGVGSFFGWVWNAVIKPAWEALSLGISWYWNNVIKVAFDALTWVLGGVGSFFGWVWNAVIKPAWEALGAGIAWVWNNVIKVAFDALTWVLGGVGRFFGWVWNTVIKPAWDGLGAGIAWVWNNVVRPAWDGMQRGLDVLKNSFQTAVDFIRRVWDGIRGAAAVPINFVIDHVINGGIFKAWNAVAGFLGLDELKPVGRIEGFDTGGYTGRGHKHDPAGIVHKGEYVLDQATTRRVGVATLDRVSRGETATQIPGYADGGFVDSMAAVVRDHFPMLSLTSGLRFTDAGYHARGQAADFSNGSDSTPEMRALAGFIADNFASSTIELIHSPFDRNIGAGGNVGDGFGFYGGATMNQHRNHVHWAVNNPVSGDGDGGGGLLGGVLSAATSWIRDKVADLFEKPVKAIGNSIPEFPGPFGAIPRAMYNKVADSTLSFIRGKVSAMGAGEPGGGAEQWRAMAMDALARTGYVPPEHYVENMLRQIQSESGGNPSIVQQVHDVNSGGNEGVGLLQIIPGTFSAYRDPELPDDRTDPFANMVAALRYVRARYGGDLNAVWGKGHGYDRGGILDHGAVGWNTSGKPEAVLTNPQWQMFEQFIEQLQHGKVVEAIDALHHPVAATAAGHEPARDTDQDTTPESTTKQPTAEDFRNQALEAGNTFLEANLDQFLGDIGTRRSGGAVQELVTVIQEQMAKEVSDQLKRSRAGSVSYIGRR